MPQRRSRRLTRIALAVGTALVALVTAGCGVGLNAATDNVGSAGDNSATQAGDIAARGLILVMDASGRASLIGTLVNLGNDPDALTAVTVTGGTATLSQGGATTSSIALPARTSLQVGYGERAVTVTGLPPLLGRFFDVTLQFGVAGTASTPVLTVPAEGIYATLAPAPAPSS